MTVELLLLRHGKAEQAKGVADRDRSLKTKGKRQAQRIGAWMQKNGLVPDLVVSSPAERAFDTAEKALKAAGQNAGVIRTDDRLYPGTRPDATAVLTDHRNCQQRILLVGHNPWMEELVHHLASGQDLSSGGDTVMKTGTLVRLSMPAWEKTLEQGGARLQDHILPQTLPERFPFDGPGGSEYRDRPAYYYRQSAALPYRWVDGELQILLIGSSKKKKWGVPKGIHELSLSAQASAAKEAEEEAGALGQIHQQAVGVYQIKKWGATCSVTVFPMAVTETLSKKDWEEDYRKRRWVSADKAVAMVSDAALSKIVAAFVKGFGPRGG